MDQVQGEGEVGDELGAGDEEEEEDDAVFLGRTRLAEVWFIDNLRGFMMAPFDLDSTSRKTGPGFMSCET